MLELSVTVLFLSHSTSSPLVNLVNSTFLIYLESGYFPQALCLHPGSSYVVSHLKHCHHLLPVCLPSSSWGSRGVTLKCSHRITSLLLNVSHVLVDGLIWLVWLLPPPQTSHPSSLPSLLLFWPHWLSLHRCFNTLSTLLPPGPGTGSDFCLERRGQSLSAQTQVPWWRLPWSSSK